MCHLEYSSVIVDFKSLNLWWGPLLEEANQKNHQRIYLPEQVLIWDIEAQPNRRAVFGAAESPPDLCDTNGHGSHTLSTAGGSFVPGANVFCYGNGTTKGGSSKARVAAYKVCWPPVGDNACFDADILAAFDVAIDDGVDIRSVSLGGDAVDFFIDSVAIGSFHVVKHGILVVCSAENSGPNAGTAENLSPWKFTVGASTIDRQFPSYVTLGNKIQFKGGSLSVEGLPTKKFYPVIGSKDAKAADASKEDAELCKAKSLDSDKVKGKILVGLRGDNARVDKGQQALSAGVVAMILANNDLSGNEIIADPHVLRDSHITYSNGLAVYQYIQSIKMLAVQKEKPCKGFHRQDYKYKARNQQLYYRISSSPFFITIDHCRPLSSATAPPKGLAVLEDVRPSAGPAKAAVVPLTDPVTLIVEEKLNVRLKRDGAVSNFDVQGTLSLQV
ncbi:hypothetical protein POM88_001998 [Heracleum sosnowskyi]|uniref:Subtilisin-like protease n=1 Tax=Heracleum sosnowskyi TaxID=360622 RepID=A0AAD8NC74_9APIA|nr:hypothetical protein POM88_001998 [Heracleum sosnowskyi]